MKSSPRAVIAAAVLMLAWALHPGSPGHAEQVLDSYDAPETIRIDSLADLYEPVVFSHKRHERLAPCKDCHHHTTGRQDMDPNCVRCHAYSPASATVSCKGCHARELFSPEQVREAGNANIYHIDKPSLKGAYHLACVPCHVAKDAPSSCVGCHAMTDKGKAFFHIDGKAKDTAEAGSGH